MKALVDLTGQKFSSWTALRQMPNDKRGMVLWLCRCKCGKEKVVRRCNLRNGSSRGCRACASRKSKNAFRHGYYKTKLYNIWARMIQRCEYSNCDSYKNYGGRGVKICVEWRGDFKIFMIWALANNYKEGLTIDRINNDGNYEPENCRFATFKQQSRNRRNNRYIKINGKIKLLIECAEKTGINYQTLTARICRNWPESRLFEPVKGKKT